MSLSYIHPGYGIKLIGLSTVLAWGMLVPSLLAQTPETSPVQAQSDPAVPSPLGTPNNLNPQTIPACAPSAAAETPLGNRSTAAIVTGKRTLIS